LLCLTRSFSEALPDPRSDPPGSPHSDILATDAHMAGDPREPGLSGLRDRHLTADAAYADIVLPATTLYERKSYMTYGPIFRLRER